MGYASESYQASLDLSDLSDLEDVMITSSDGDIPTLDDMVELCNGLWLAKQTFT